MNDPTQTISDTVPPAKPEAQTPAEPEAQPAADPDVQPADDAQPADDTRRKRRLRIARNVAIGVLGTLFAAWLILFVTKGRFLKGPTTSIATSMTGREVAVEGDFQLYFAPFRIKFVAEGLTVANPKWATRPHLFAARRVDTRIAPLALLFGNWRLHWLDLTDGALDLEWNAKGTANTWTFDVDKDAEPLELPTINRATLRGTTLRYRDPVMQLLTDIDLASVVSKDAKIGEAVRFTGDGTLRKTPFTLTGALLSPNATVRRGQNQLELQLKAANNVIDIMGTLPSLADVEGVPLATKARGRNAAELMAIIGVVIPQTRKYQAKAQLVKQGRLYRFTDLTGTFGASDIAGKFTVDMGKARVHLDADLATKTLDIIDVAPFIGYNPDVIAARGVQAA
uniref:AsmA family protein n=1 Tax=Blastomonas sp. TaxID=1909299 RepID=UPI00359342DF